MIDKFIECTCDTPRPKEKPEYNYQQGFMFLNCKNCGNCIAWESLGDKGK